MPLRRACLQILTGYFTAEKCHHRFRLEVNLVHFNYFMFENGSSAFARQKSLTVFMLYNYRLALRSIYSFSDLKKVQSFEDLSIKFSS